MTKPSSADLAHVKVRAHMNVQVGPQVALAKESLFAYGAYLGSLLKVQPSMMIVQLRSTVEALPTLEAFESFQHAAPCPLYNLNSLTQSHICFEVTERNTVQNNVKILQYSISVYLIPLCLI